MALTFANSLTLLRYFLSPIVLLLLLFDFPIAAFIIFIIALATDLFDGISARRNENVSEWGIIHDPLADKVLIVPLIVYFWWSGLVYIFITVLIVGREIITTILRHRARQKDISIPANILGKFKMGLEAVAIIVLFIISIFDLDILDIVSLLFAANFLLIIALYFGLSASIKYYYIFRRDI